MPETNSKSISTEVSDFALAKPAVLNERNEGWEDGS